MEGSVAKKIYLNDKSTANERIVLCFAEFVGTAILVFLGCAGCVRHGAALTEAPLLQIALTFGFAVVVALQCIGHISGGHINPAVTVAAAILGHIPLLHIPLYFIGQMLGGIAGYGLLSAVTPSVNLRKGDVDSMGVCSPGISEINAVEACAVEFILTFILIIACAAVWDCRNSNKHDSVGLRLGFTIAVLAMVGAPYSGANLNPARTFGPVLLAGDFDDNHWVYWLGPMAAGVAGGYFYRYIFSKEVEEDNNTAEAIPLNDKA